MVLINGEDKTDSVASLCFQDGMCEIIYSSALKLYSYHEEKVQLLKVQSWIDPSQFIITVDGYAILVDEEFSCLEFDMNRDTISWIRRKIEYRRSLMEHFPKKISENGIDYTLVGDYYISDLHLPEENRPIGIWGRMHKVYLEQCHPAQYNNLILTSKLWTYLGDLNEQAQNRLDCIIVQMKEVEGIKEELKV